MYTARWVAGAAIAMTVIACFATDANAQRRGDLGRSVIETVGTRVLARARRAYVLGPFVGGAGAVTFDGDSDGLVTFGVGFTKFDLSVFGSRRELMDILKRRLLEGVRLRMDAALARGEQPTEADRQRMAEEALAQLRAELLLELRPKRLEKPGLHLRLEGNYLTSAEAFDLRVAGAVGVSRVFIGTGAALRVDDGADFVIPVELSLPIALSMGPRSHLLDVFARVDFAITDRDNQPDIFMFGARLSLDII